MVGASVVAMGATGHVAYAQDDTDTEQSSNATDSDNEIVVTGIRASLQQAMNIKRDAQGVVDAISAEDIGKFPDTNLAESLQRITGVSIDRQNGEGSKVTVRGFGPDFNLVLLNGRQMPASGLGSCCEAPASRSFDFANLASEGIAGVEVYKSGRVSLPTGGIGSTINIKLPMPLDRPGLQGSFSAKAVYDTGLFSGTDITPEVSGIISKTFADDTLGVLVAGSYQKRKASLAQFNAGWREGYLGSDSSSWGSLPADANDWRGFRVENHPGPNDTYQTTQNAGYDFTDIDRERFNGQAVLQWRPSDDLAVAIDYEFSQNTLKARTSSIGVWFNHASTSSSWTDGPAAGPNFYAEDFGPGKDLAVTGAIAANRNINNSIGGNIQWDGFSGLHLEIDGHHSTAESKPTTPYGSNIAVGSAIFGVMNQRVDYTTAMPVISVNMYPGSEIDASNIRPAGNAFRNAYMKDTIDEVAFKGRFDIDESFIQSLDFGVVETRNKVRSAYGFIQTDSWGGTLGAADTPDDLYTMVNLPHDLAGMAGSQSSSIIPSYFRVNTVDLINLLENEVNICSAPWTGSAIPGTCLAEFQADRRIKEETTSFYVQSTHKFYWGMAPINFRFGVRFEDTRVVSSALVPIPTGTSWVGDNEIAILYGGGSDFQTLKGSYENFLPAADFDIEPVDNLIFRASYSQTITRPDYNSLQGGTTLAAPIRVGGSTGASGNPGLLPYKSNNIDLSAEWYYGPSSYVSVGFFNKNVKNFIANNTVKTTAFDLTNPAIGPRVAEAQAALGAGATTTDIRNWIKANYSQFVDAASGGILGQPDDPFVDFNITSPINSDQKARLWGWEFAVQHSFWETGFGAILNYTIVNSDTAYDNTIPAFTTPGQFAVNGVSDSANAVLFYDKDGLQARVAYNWRDKFLSGYGTDPFYIEAYGQVDVSASYEFGNGFSVFAEGINVTNEDRRGHMRNKQTVFFAAPGYARYAAGVRYTF
ncbi:TonB-dependent receptor [Croceibacterium salegens]|nr:TonB-dependent receptor [Croceibacterium salegens]